MIFELVGFGNSEESVEFWNSERNIVEFYSQEILNCLEIRNLFC